MNNHERDTVSAAAAAIPIPQMSEPLTHDQLSQLFADHHRRVLIAAYRVTGSMADAEDVAQTVFMRLGAAKACRRRMPAATCTGQRSTARSTCCAGEKPPPSSPSSAAESIASTRLSRRRRAFPVGTASPLRQASASWRRAPAEMFTLRYIEELGNREIAALMGTSQAVVAVTLHQTRSKLKKRLHCAGTGEVMKRHDHELLNKAIEAVRTSEPDRK